MESVGFKEWALVCEALGTGEQSLILRKGGIAEGRAGFQFKHREFFLFPTFFHEQAEKTRGVPMAIPQQRDGEIEIRLFGKLEHSAVVTAWETLVALEPLHILRREVVRERFEYDEAPGINVGFLRVFRLSKPWVIPELPAYGGCRSWVQLPEFPPELRLEPVLSDAEHASRKEQIERALGEP